MGWKTILKEVKGLEQKEETFIDYCEERGLSPEDMERHDLGRKMREHIQAFELFGEKLCGGDIPSLGALLNFLWGDPIRAYLDQEEGSESESESEEDHDCEEFVGACKQVVNVIETLGSHKHVEGPIISLPLGL